MTRNLETPARARYAMNGQVYTGDGWKVICGRWQDSPPKSVDVVISDPPFTDHISGNRARIGGSDIARARKERRHGFKVEVHKGSYSFKGIDPREIGPQIVPIAKRWCVLFCAIEQIGIYSESMPDYWIRGGIWTKPNGCPQFTGDRSAACGEGLSIFHPKGRKHWNGHGRMAWWNYNTTTILAASGQKYHETQKPLALMLDLVRLFSNPGELVYDPYGGSGTTGIACLRLGRRFLMHEMQPHYAKIAAERLEAETRGLTLQDARRGQMSILDTMGDS